MAMAPAHAALVSYQLDLQVTFAWNNTGSVMPVVAPGTLAHFNYTLDTSITDPSASSSLAIYTGAITSASLEVPGQTFVIPTSNALGEVNQVWVQYRDGPQSVSRYALDLGTATYYSGDSGSIDTNYVIDWQPAAIGSGNTLTSSTALAQLLDLQAMDPGSRIFQFSFDKADEFGQTIANGGLTGNIVSLTEVPPVPLPASGWLLLSTLGVLAGAGATLRRRPVEPRKYATAFPVAADLARV